MEFSVKLSGNTILITGGTSGIGYALAEQLLQSGNTVLITGRSEARLADARQSLSGFLKVALEQVKNGRCRHCIRAPESGDASGSRAAGVASLSVKVCVASRAMFLMPSAFRPRR